MLFRHFEGSNYFSVHENDDGMLNEVCSYETAALTDSCEPVIELAKSSVLSRKSFAGAIRPGYVELDFVESA